MVESKIKIAGYLTGGSGRVGGLLLVLMSAAVMSATNARAQTLTTLYSFKGVNGDGAQPIAGLIADPAGNLYGTTVTGGMNQCSSVAFRGSGCGVVFELMPPTSSGGNWTEKILYRFTGGSDGSQPWAGLIADKSGNLYGTATGGGQSGCSDGLTGCGVVFELVNSSGTYTYKVLYAFTGRPDGAGPIGGLIQDSSGNLYGTAAVNGLSGCGLDGCGTVFELTPPSSPGGIWSETTLYWFTGVNGDGGHPVAALIQDSSGNLYGTANAGGMTSSQCGPFPFTQSTGCGIVFELVNSSGTYTEKILHSFTGSDGGNPYTFSTGLIADASGNLYGTTALGTAGCSDTFSCGVVFKLTPPASSGGNWTETVLHSFTNGTDGAVPFSSLIADNSGNLYATAAGGYVLTPCSGSTCGTIFKLSGGGFVPPVHFAGVPGTQNCNGVSVSTLSHTYGGIAAAAKALGYSSVSALQSAIAAYCGN